jgi:hypothetical protein
LRISKSSVIVVAIAAVCAYLAGGSIAHPFVDGDLYWQRWLGESVLSSGHIPSALGNEVFTAQGAPWVAQEWLSSMLVAVLFRTHAIWLLAVLTGVTYFAALAVCAFRAKRNGATVNGTLLMLVAGVICIVPSFVLRAQIWVLPLFAALLLTLDFDDVRSWWSIAPIVLWANLHASAVLAIPVVWLDALTKPAAWRSRVPLCIAAAAALFCTPLGWRLLQYALEAHPSRQYIYEWSPIARFDVQIVAGFIPLLALSLYAGIRQWRTRLRDVVLVAVLAVYAIVHQRNIPFFAIAAMPLAALAIGGAAGWARAAQTRTATILAAAAALVLLPLCAWAGYAVSSSQPPIFTPPDGSLAALRTQSGPHRLLCTNYGWCAAFLGEPGVRIFIDGRADPFPADVWQAYLTIIRGEPGWDLALDRYEVNAVLARRGGPLDARLQATPQWHAVATSDLCCDLYVRE